MIKKKLLGWSLAVLLLGGMPLTYAEPMVVDAEGQADMGDNDTRMDVKQRAFKDAKRMAVERAGTWLTSNTEVVNGQVTKDEVVTAAVGRVEVLSGPEYTSDANMSTWRAKIKARVDTAQMEQIINELAARKKAGQEVATHEPTLPPLAVSVDAAPTGVPAQVPNVIPPKRAENMTYEERVRVTAAMPDNYVNYPGVEAFNGHHYKVFNTVNVTWMEAQMLCKEAGGHLAVITSKEEYDFIWGLIQKKGNKNCYWLGASRDKNNRWSWVNGESLSFTKWADKQPDNWGTEDVLMIYRLPNPMAKKTKPGQWNDINSDGSCFDEPFFGKQNFGLVCEWDA